jgi:hypothetical protein
VGEEMSRVVAAAAVAAVSDVAFGSLLFTVCLLAAMCVCASDYNARLRCEIDKTSGKAECETCWQQLTSTVADCRRGRR